MKRIQEMFRKVSVIISIQSSNLIVEEVINYQLVNIVSQCLVRRIFINSHSCEFFNSLKNFIFIIYNFSKIEP